MNLNLGCGNFKFDDFINVDKVQLYQPDVLHDLEVLPWPFESNSADNIVLSHVLEHLGQTPSLFIQILKEIYRISKNGCLLYIDVPCPRSKYYLSDPTHVRPITPDLIDLFNKKSNHFYSSKDYAISQLGIENNVDFEVLKVDMIVDKDIYNKAGYFKYYNYDHAVISNAYVLPNVGKNGYHDLSSYNCNIIINMHILVRCNKSDVDN
jgi:SAM-dependent methyltransferase